MDQKQTPFISALRYSLFRIYCVHSILKGTDILIKASWYWKITLLSVVHLENRLDEFFLFTSLKRFVKLLFSQGWMLIRGGSKIVGARAKHKHPFWRLYTDSTFNYSIKPLSDEQNYNIVSHFISSLAPWKVSQWQSWASKSELLTNWPPLWIPDWSVSVRQPLAAANIIQFFCPHFDNLLAERRRSLILCCFLSRELGSLAVVT